MVTTNNGLEFDLSGLDLGEVEVFVQQGARGIPEFAASSGKVCVEAGSSSCNSSTEPDVDAF